MAFTPLHRALGLTPSPLEFSMVLQAINQGLEERDDLDWKKELPKRQHPNADIEFAKDVTALVNNGGGMIVYGIAESASAAASIVSVEGWDDAAEQRLRSWAYTLIQPPVYGLDFQLLSGQSSEESESLAVALLVPASPDTPHFVIQRGSIRAPRRYGSHTVDMSEREIEQAYRRRFEDRRNNDRALEDLLEQSVLGTTQDRIWMSAAARPTRPRPRYLGRISRTVAQAALAEFTRNNPFLSRAAESIDADVNPRPGYRKWRSTQMRQGSARVIVDIYDDGSVALATSISESRTPGFESETDIHAMDAETMPAHICHLVRTVASQLSMSGEYEVSITVSSPFNRPIFVRTFEQTGRSSFLRNREDLAPIHKFQPVSGIVEATGLESEALATVRELALDILNQGGSASLSNLYLQSPVDE